jgi:hypothetical protein
MARITVDIVIPIYCSCGEHLEQVHEPNETDSITVKSCRKCADEVRSQAYNKGVDYGLLCGMED